MRVKVRGKSSDTSHSIWVEGKLVPGTKEKGQYYIEQGGYPGSNIYQINVCTLCKQTAAVDRLEHEVYENDILLYETEEEFKYFLVYDAEMAVDIINGEILELGIISKEDITIIGNQIDFSDFIDGITYHVENSLEIPYLPILNVQATKYPYFKMQCLKCGKTVLSCAYIAKHKECGGYFEVDFTTKVYRERQK